MKKKPVAANNEHARGTAIVVVAGTPVSEIQSARDHVTVATITLSRPAVPPARYSKSKPFRDWM